MKTDWKKVKLQDICESISDGDHLPPPKAEKGIPFVTISNIKNNQFDFTNTMFVPELYYEKLDNKRKAKIGDILYSVVGSFGIPVLIKNNEKIVFQRHIAILRPEKIDSHFLFYTMLSKAFYAKANAVAIGAAQRTVSLTALRNIEISLPPLETQQKIASILSAYDDLIENNRKQIKLLEEAAQRLYKEWFVDLRFPGYENVAIVDGVPEGWRIEQLGSLLPIVTGKKDANFGTKDGMYPFFTCSQEPIKAPSYSFDANAILLAGNGDLNVKIFRGKFEAYQRTYVLVPNEQEHLFICYRTVQDNLRKLIHGASGSTIKFITKGMIENIDVIIPQDEILIKFNILSDNILKKMEKLQRQIYLSQQARDKLLPRLMSGDMEV